MTTSHVRLVLGSRSPRRRELLSQLLPAAQVEVVPPRSPDEAGFEGLNDRAAIAARLLEIARVKCDDVVTQLADRGPAAPSEVGAASRAASESGCGPARLAEPARPTVITADTTIVAHEPDGRPVVLGQPPEDDRWAETVALWFRRYYAGRTHEVLTAFCVAPPTGERIERLVATSVTFTADVDHWLDWYLSTGEPRGKAGGYALQGAGSVFVTKVRGSLSNVVGLPLGELLEVLAEHGIVTPGPQE